MLGDCGFIMIIHTWVDVNIRILICEIITLCKQCMNGINL